MLKNLSTFVDIFSLVYISTLERRKMRLSQRIQLFYSAFAFLFSFPTLRKSQFLYRKRFSFWTSTVFGNVQASAVCSEKFEKRKSHPLSPSHAQSCFTEKLSLSLHFRQLEPKVLLSRKNTQKNKHWKSYFTFVWQQQQRPRVWKLRKSYSVNGWDDSWKVDWALSSSSRALHSFYPPVPCLWSVWENLAQVSNCLYKFSYPSSIPCVAANCLKNFSQHCRAIGVRIIRSFFNELSLWCD